MERRISFLYVTLIMFVVSTCVTARKLGGADAVVNGYVVSEPVSSTGSNGYVVSEPVSYAANANNGYVVSEPVSAHLTGPGGGDCGDVVVNGNVISNPASHTSSNGYVVSEPVSYSGSNGYVVSELVSYAASNGYVVSEPVSYSGTKSSVTGPGNGGGNGAGGVGGN